MIRTLVVTLDGEPLLGPDVRPFERQFEVPDDATKEEIEAMALVVFDRAIKWDVKGA